MRQESCLLLTRQLLKLIGACRVLSVLLKTKVNAALVGRLQLLQIRNRHLLLKAAFFTTSPNNTQFLAILVVSDVVVDIWPSVLSF